MTAHEDERGNRRTKEVSTDRGTITYGYGLANNVISITEGRGITSTMTYDTLERVLTKTYPNTITNNVTYTYDTLAATCSFGTGYLCSRTDESDTTRYNYDSFGNIIDMTFTERQSTIYTTHSESRIHL